MTDKQKQSFLGALENDTNFLKEVSALILNEIDLEGEYTKNHFKLKFTIYSESLQLDSPVQIKAKKELSMRRKKKS